MQRRAGALRRCCQRSALARLSGYSARINRETPAIASPPSAETPANAQPASAEAPAETTGEPVSRALALLFDEPITKLPEDLYIPPEALRVFLETFEGPLDLLLYLIRRQNLDILGINVAAITHQYIEYVELMKAMQIELAGEYLLMAAMLAEIKSRTLLPRPPKAEDDEEEDPRAELIRRLQEYERLKDAAETLDTLPRTGRDWFSARVEVPALDARVIHPEVELSELLGALGDILKRAELTRQHQISREVLSTRERMLRIMEALNHAHYTPFESLFTLEEGRAGVVVTFMAILELAKEAMIEIVQNAPLSPIHVRARDAGPEQDEARDGHDGGESAFADEETP
ncbi:MAG: segregation/condensation protein A [Halomonas sp.]|nr:ScpA family protein [Halomonas sp.]MDN6296931.1 segregation/condensation protein A [Halomonas sp.]MDN6314521.1 segregation/condensation protein A [Halomonas sp.]MDN6336023.1 segregation/condensation protein A [Halomonas sp.]